MFYNYNKYGQIWELICNCIQATYWSLLFVLWSAFPKNAHKNGFLPIFWKALYIYMFDVTYCWCRTPAKKEVFYKIM